METFKARVLDARLLPRHEPARSPGYYAGDNRFLGGQVERQTRKSSPEASSTLHVISPARPLSSGLMVFGRFCFADLQTARLKLASHSIAIKRRARVTAWALSSWVSKLVQSFCTCTCHIDSRDGRMYFSSVVRVYLMCLRLRSRCDASVCLCRCVSLCVYTPCVLLLACTSFRYKNIGGASA